MSPFAPIPKCTLEAALVAAESTLGVTITIRDLTGWLRDQDDTCLINSERLSHKRQMVCALGFTKACIDHCRHAASAAIFSSREAQTSVCWKGVREVLVPVIHGGTVHWYLFAGAWRGEGPAKSGSWSVAWRQLPLWDEQRAATITAALRLLADGLWVSVQNLRQQSEPADRAGRIRAFIRLHLADGVGRTGLARHLGLSPSRTSHAVREACGMSLQDVFIHERVLAAQRLLSGSNDPIAVIGERVGWADPPHFSRIFRRHAGVSPGAWRMQQRLA